MRPRAADRTISGRFPELPQHARVTVSGIVVARQRPGTAKGYVFVLMEDEAGPVNVIVRPKIYERDRTAVRMEPFLTVRGRLQKDGATLNVIAERVEPLRAEGTPGVESGPMKDVTDTEVEDERLAADAFRYLTALRQTPPEVKSFS